MSVNGKTIDPILVRAIGDLVRDIAKPAEPALVRLSMEQGIPDGQVMTLVDGMSRIADAVLAQAEAVGRQNELLVELTKAISEITITVPPGAIVVNVPPATINLPEQKKREITIKHEDGTRTVVKET